MKKLTTILLLIATELVFADTVTFQPPTEREDNTPLASEEISGFNVYDVGNGGVELLTLPATATNFDLTRTSADQSVVITTVDTEGRESTFSEVIVIPKLVSRPKPPTIISITP